jgi:hypothetical protein
MSSPVRHSPILTWQDGGVVSQVPLTQVRLDLHSTDRLHGPHIGVTPLRRLAQSRQLAKTGMASARAR